MPIDWNNAFECAEWKERTRRIENVRRLERAEDFIASQGYRRCDIPACNCGSWHGGNANQRLMELVDYIQEHGMWHGTVLDSVKFVFRAYGIDKEVL